MTRSLLHSIRLVEGQFRGLTAMQIDFKYPITAICGKNGAGKSTLTALACCAFHNTSGGYRLPRRKLPYYTFSDFFIQHPTEEVPQAVMVQYFIASNQWRKSSRFPDGVGLAYQVRRKAKGGKWNDYDARVNRTVVFLGIERVVPHAERSQSRSYSKAFKDAPLRGWENEVMKSVGTILGKKYDGFRYVVHSKYSLPIVQVGSSVYSGFNMGAGENALFDIFSTIYSAGPGALIVIDEIELGLHAEAQRKLVEQLKDVCASRYIQVICTTHSREVLDGLPPDARFYIESINGSTVATSAISAAFAFSKLSSVNGQEADLLVEDDVAKAILLAALPAAIRTRVTVKIIGSANALARQLAAAYIRDPQKYILAIFDGDQLAKSSINFNHAKSMAENTDENFKIWFENRSAYLAGGTWPEAWLIKRSRQIPATLARIFGTDEPTLISALDAAQRSGKHKELAEFGRQLGLERTQCLQLLSTAVVREFDDEFTALLLRVQQTLDGHG